MLLIYNRSSTGRTTDEFSIDNNIHQPKIACYTNVFSSPLGTSTALAGVESGSGLLFHKTDIGANHLALWAGTGYLIHDTQPCEQPLQLPRNVTRYGVANSFCLQDAFIVIHRSAPPQYSFASRRRLVMS